MVKRTGWNLVAVEKERVFLSLRSHILTFQVRELIKKLSKLPAHRGSLKRSFENVSIGRYD